MDQQQFAEAGMFICKPVEQVFEFEKTVGFRTTKNL